MCEPNTAAHLAREVGVHRTTIVEYIRQGKITARSHRKGRHWHISEQRFRESEVDKLRKPYPKYSNLYSPAEIYILINSKGIKMSTLAKRLNRSENAIRIKLCRLRKENPYMR